MVGVVSSVERPCSSADCPEHDWVHGAEAWLQWCGVADLLLLSGTVVVSTAA
jgi:hypothetical protein